MRYTARLIVNRRSFGAPIVPGRSWACDTDRCRDPTPLRALRALVRVRHGQETATSHWV